MDISINNVNFTGKKEVLYGMKMAAKEARNAEGYRALMQCPRPLNRTVEEKTSKKLMNAYIDMAVIDDSFESVIKEYEDEGLKKILQPEKWQYIEANPLKLFKEAMLKAMQKHEKSINIETMNEFFANLVK